MGLSPLARRVPRFVALPRQRKKLLIEAFFQLMLARLLLRVVSFRRLMSFFSPPLAAIAPSGPEREKLRQDIRWAIERASRLLPGKTVCFPRGIAAQIMCRKRGINTILWYGAKVSPVTGLTAHVWVQDGSEGIVGHQVAREYQILASFPGGHC